MSLIIDGYNLLNATGIVGRGAGRTGLQSSRLAMLNFLAESLEPEDVRRTTVVFDASNPPRGMTRVLDHRGLTVRFASAYADADELIEELIRADSSPRRLTVVSSDHRLQRAARRRKATAVDSDVWYRRLVRCRSEQREPADTPARPPVPLLQEDVDYWIRQFGGQSRLEKLIEEESRETPPAAEEPATEAPATEGRPGCEPPTEEAGGDKPLPEEMENPFPPGYAEDLLETEDTGEPYNPFPPGYGEDLEAY